MTEEEKEESQLTELLKEKGISIEDLKTMINESVDTALEESEVEEEEIEVEQTEESEPEPETPTFTKEDVMQLVADEVKRSLKIKRKVPSKGKIIKKDKLTDTKVLSKREALGEEYKEALV